MSKSLYYNSAHSYLFVNGIKIHKFKVKDSQINTALLCLGNISKDFSADNTKKTGWYEYGYDFSVDYGSTDVTDILDFLKYLMVNN